MNGFKTISIFFSVSVLLAFAVFMGQKLISDPVPVEKVFPGKVWAKTVAQLPDLQGVGAPRAENCGKCHEEIYKEWKSSTHSEALSDLQFQAELSKTSSPKWICLNCHIPIQNQRENIVVSLNHGDYFQPIEIPNPGFDPIMQKEAITCATCHVRTDGKGASYVIGANGKTNPPHPVKIDAEALRNRCYDCHNETYELNESLVCSFQTGGELKEASKHFSEKTCVNCHLPSVQRSFVIPALKRPKRNSHKHAFIGGGVPKRFELYKDQIPGGYKPGIALVGWEKKDSDIVVKIQNGNAGHYLPSADPERHLKLELVWLDKDRKEIAKDKIRYGQDWEWSPKARKVADNRLKPKEIRDWKTKIFSQEAVSVVLRVYHVRLTDTTSDYVEKYTVGAPKEYEDKIKELKKHYPHSSLVLESEYNWKTKKVSNTALPDLFKLNESRRGE
ncbi:cytochrome c family protein [Leptospira ilyithenensis]|nr:cytochrome c family protein [Leptospira ilyithenensis]